MDKILRVCKSEELPALVDRDPNYIYFVYDKMRLHFYQSFYTDPFSIVEKMPEKEDAVENMLYLILDGTMKTYIDYSIIEVGVIEDNAQLELLKQAGTIYFMNAESRYLDWQKRTVQLPFQNGSYQLSLNLMKDMKIDRDTVIRFNEETNQFYIAGKEYQHDNKLDNIGKLGASYTDSVRTTIDQYKNWIKSDIRLAPDEDNDLSVKWNGLYINVSDHATQADFDALLDAYQKYRTTINNYIFELKDALQQVTGAVSNDTIGEKILQTLETYKSTIDDMYDKYEDLANRTAALERESTTGVDNRIEQIKKEIIDYINGLQHPWEKLNPDLNPPLEHTSDEFAVKKILINEFRKHIIELRLLEEMAVVVIESEDELPDEEIEATYFFLYNETANTFQEYEWDGDEYSAVGPLYSYTVVLGGDDDNTEEGGGVESTNIVETYNLLPTEDVEEGAIYTVLNDWEDIEDGIIYEAGQYQYTDGSWAVYTAPTNTDPDPEDEGDDNEETPTSNTVETYNLLPTEDVEEWTIYIVLNDWTDEDADITYPAGEYQYIAGAWEFVESADYTVTTYNLLPTEDIADGTVYTVLEDWTDEETSTLYPAGPYVFYSDLEEKWIVYEYEDPFAVDTYNLLPLDPIEGVYYTVKNDWYDEDNDITHVAGVYTYRDGMWHYFDPDNDTPTEPSYGTVATYNLLPTNVAQGSIYTVENDWTDEDTNITYLAEQYIYYEGKWIVYEGDDNGGDSGDDNTDDSSGGGNTYYQYNLTDSEAYMQKLVFEEFDNICLIMRYYKEYRSMQDLPYPGDEFIMYYVIQHGRHFIIENEDGTYSALRINYDGSIYIGEPTSDKTTLTADTIYHIYQYESGDYVLVYNHNNNYEAPEPIEPDDTTPTNQVDTYNLLPIEDIEEGTVYTVLNDWSNEETGDLYPAGNYIFAEGSWVRIPDPIDFVTVETYDMLPTEDIDEGTVAIVTDSWTNEETSTEYPAGRYIFLDGEWILDIGDGPQDDDRNIVDTYNLLPTDVEEGTIYIVNSDWTNEDTGVLYPAGNYQYTEGSWVAYTTPTDPEDEDPEDPTPTTNTVETYNLLPTEEVEEGTIYTVTTDWTDEESGAEYLAGQYQYSDGSWSAYTTPTDPDGNSEEDDDENNTGGEPNEGSGEESNP